MPFRNYYLCSKCAHVWIVIWSAPREHDCPWCELRYIAPYLSVYVEESGDE